MAFRLLISGAVWAEVEPVLRDLKHAAGRPPALSDRLFIEAVLYQARTGTPWRDLPEAFGDWNAVSHRFRRWEQRTLWQRLGEGSTAARTTASRTSSSLRPWYGLISTPPAPPQKTAGNQPRLWVALGGPVHQTARGLPRRPSRRLVRAERGRAPRRGGIRAGVAGAAGGGIGAGGCGEGQGL